MARSSFKERLINGAKINSGLVANWLTAEQDDPKGTALPVLELFIRRERLQALSGHLPQSGRIFQPGVFKAREKAAPNIILPANLRFRGDSLNHWAFPQKSWRVKLKHGARYRGMRQFNLYLPRSRSQIPDFLGYQLAQEMGGLVVPKALPVHLRLNRRFDGLRVLLEQIDNEFFVSRSLHADRFLVGDIDFNSLYLFNLRHKLFESPAGWEINSLSKSPHPADAELKSLLNAISLVESDPSAFKAAIESILDVPGELRYMAYLEIVGSVHVDETHNQRFFFDADSQRLRPIVWDPVAYYWDSREVMRGIDFGKNALFRALLIFPEYREQKNRYIWESINGSLENSKLDQLIRGAADSIRKEVLASEQGVFTDSSKIGVLPHSEWDEAVQSLAERSKARNRFLRETLQKTSLVLESRMDGDHTEKITIRVGADAGFLTESLLLVPRKGKQEPREVGVLISDGRVTTSLKASYDPLLGGYLVPFEAHLFSVRRYDRNDNGIRESGVFNYQVIVPGASLAVAKLKGRNSITGETFDINANSGNS
jgi:hypothetical protein